MEICRQKLLLVKEESFEYNQKISAAPDVLKFVIETLKIRNEPQEVVYLLTINTGNYITGFSEIARGGNNWCSLLISEVFKAVLMSNCNKFILIHNHPSGDSTPSNQDIRMTQDILKGAEILKLQLLDHIVVGDNNYQSIMKEIKI